MTREEQAQARRQQILQIALEEFIAKGFYGTSTRQISKLAGVSTGLMFHYFASKEALYECLVEIGCERMRVDFTDSEQNPLDYLSQLVTGILQELARNAIFARMCVFIDQALHAPGISTHVDELLASHEMTRQCIPVIERGQQLGQFRSGDPRALAVAFLGAIQGIAQEVARDAATPLPLADWILAILVREGGAK